MGGDFDIHSDPQGGEFDSTAMSKSREDLGMSDEWCVMSENTQNSSERISHVKGYQQWLNERISQGAQFQNVLIFHFR